MSNTYLNLAIEYGARGWNVFPIGGDKKPPQYYKWRKRSSNAEGLIRGDARTYARASGVGLDCGKSGIVVVDLDVKDGKNGKETWRKLKEEYGFTDTGALVTKTPSGGTHLIFTDTTNGEARNRAGFTDKEGGIDIRGNGGYIVLPGSRNGGTGTYEWIEDGGAPAPLPAKLVGLLLPPQKPPAPQQAQAPEAASAWAGKAFEDEVALVASATKGTRNDQLNKSAFALGQIVAGGYLPRSEVESALAGAGKSTGLNEKEVNTAIKSGLDAGLGKPRHPTAGWTVQGTQPHTPQPEAPSWTFQGIEKSDKCLNSSTSPAPKSEQGKPEQQSKVSAKFTTECFYRDETGDSEMYARLFTGGAIFDHATKQWYLWNEHRWTPDQTRYTTRMVSCDVSAEYVFTAGKIMAGARALTDTDEAKAQQRLADKMVARSRTLRGQQRIKNVLGLATSVPSMALTGSEWGLDPWLLAVGNGVVELKTGACRNGRPEDFIKTHSKTTFDPSATCPRWERFLLEIFAGDAEIVAFMQRLLGYGLTGVTTDHVLPILWGSKGRNGKDTMLKVLEEVLGGYASAIPEGALVQESGKPGGATPHLCVLQNLRLGWASETRDGARLNAAQVKKITGGGTITARALYSSPITFSPSHLVMLITNHRPHADADDSALWKRIKLIPFTQQFVDNPAGPDQHHRDPTLAETLKSEASGILNWLIEGCLEWQRVGLQSPRAVELATEEYQEDEDTFGIFIDECCYVGGRYTVKGKQFYATYAGWCKDGGQKPMSRQAFGSRAASRYTKKRKETGQVYEGVGISILP